jgi:hypothetical protein
MTQATRLGSMRGMEVAEILVASET